MSSEIIIYRPGEDSSFHLDVRMENETVWLSQSQMAQLFEATKQNISLHINNIFREGELSKDAVVKVCLTTAADGKKYKTAFYNLDVIISVGYRVKSKRGTHFRIWANNIIKDFLLKGYSVDSRLNLIEQRLNDQHEKIEFILRTELKPSQGIFFDGQIYDAWIFAAEIIRNATNSIILIDNYIDEKTLLLLSKRKAGVDCMIFTSNIHKQLQADLEKHNTQYPAISVKEFRKSHDRFLIIDHSKLYHIGASLKDLGKKWFAFSLLDIDAGIILKNLQV